MAQEIGCPLAVIHEMPSEEFLGWLEFLSFQNAQEKKAYKEAKNGKGKRR